MTEKSTSSRWVLLLRGINVGGARRMGMAALRDCLSAAGFAAVRTYIQSGNVIVETPTAIDAAAVRGSAAKAIAETFGFEPPIQVMTIARLESIIEANPYSEAGDADPRSVHYYFIDHVPFMGDLARLSDLATPGEEFTVGHDVVYLFAPHGIGRSRLAASLAGRLGSEVTVRNHRSVTAIASLACA